MMGARVSLKETCSVTRLLVSLKSIIKIGPWNDSMALMYWESASAHGLILDECGCKQVKLCCTQEAKMMHT